MLTAEDKVLYARLSEEERVRNGVPSAELARRRELGFSCVADRLAGLPVTHAVRTSPLGPAWASDVDVHLAEPLDPSVALSWGWLSLDRLLRQLGNPEEGRWAATDRGMVCAAVDFHVTPIPDAVTAVVARCRRRGEVRLREVLELRALARGLGQLPAHDPVVALAADVESGLGGTVLSAWRSGRPCAAPAPLPGHRWLRCLYRAVHQVIAPRVVVVIRGPASVSNQIASALQSDLMVAGVPAAVHPAVIAVARTRPGVVLCPSTGDDAMPSSHIDVMMATLRRFGVAVGPARSAAGALGRRSSATSGRGTVVIRSQSLDMDVRMAVLRHVLSVG
jgi:hypothetical protein